MKLSKVAPQNFLDGLALPMMLVLADQDEMIKFQEVKSVFLGACTGVKRLRVIRGSHSSDRDSQMISQISKFCSMIFKLNPIDHLSTLHI